MGFFTGTLAIIEITVSATSETVEGRAGVTSEVSRHSASTQNRPIGTITDGRRQSEYAENQFIV